MTALIKGCLVAWHPTGELRNVTTYSARWHKESNHLEYEWERTMVDHTKENRKAGGAYYWIEKEWRTVPHIRTVIE